MKTIEEKGGDFATNYEVLDDGGRRKNEYEIARESYIAGAKEEHKLLTRWHDPKEEMPEHRKQVLVKTDTGNHDVAYYSDNVDGWIANDGIYNTAQIIGWREIHE